VGGGGVAVAFLEGRAPVGGGGEKKGGGEEQGEHTARRNFSQSTPKKQNPSVFKFKLAKSKE
jgi:hypothetical protein